MRVLSLGMALVLVAACGSPVPSPPAKPSVSIAASPTASVASPAPSPTSAPSGPAASPTVECADPSVFTPPPTLTCAAAVAAAQAAVASAGTVTKITFSYGAWCAPGRDCGPVQPFGGYVVFQFADGTATLVTVSPGKQGTLVSAGRPGPFPPALAHYASWDGWGFDYPPAWRLSPAHWTFSFQSTVGYIGTIPVDPGTICQQTGTSISCNFRAYDLPPGNVVVFLSRGGGWFQDPIKWYDHPARGTRIEVAGMPAIFIPRTIAPDRELLTWMIARPDAVSNWIQLDAEIRGPDDGTLRAQLDALIASFEFVPPAVPLATDSGVVAAIAARAVATIRTYRPAAYTCFPDRTGVTQRATIRELPDLLLKKPLRVGCSVRLKPTDVGLWRLQFVVSWAAAVDHSAGALLIEWWLLADGTPQSGGPDSDRIPHCCRPNTLAP